MNTQENIRQAHNETVAADLTRTYFAQSKAASTDHIWNIFIDFYNRIDKHNCPAQKEEKQSNPDKVGMYYQSFGSWPSSPADLPPVKWKSKGISWNQLNSKYGPGSINDVQPETSLEDLPF